MSDQSTSDRQRAAPSVEVAARCDGDPAIDRADDRGRDAEPDQSDARRSVDERGSDTQGDAGKAKADTNGDAAKGDTNSESGVAEASGPGFPRLAIFAALVVVAGLIAWGVYGHWRTNSQATQTQQQTTDMVPTVRVATAKREDAPIDTVLPGQTEAFQIANIYAGATGYIAERKVVVTI